MEFKKKTPVLKKNRFPFESASPDTDVLYQGITHTLYIKKKSKNPLKQREIKKITKHLRMSYICITFVLQL